MPDLVPSHRPALPAVFLPGLHLDSLGLCLAALGLLSLCARRWPVVRGGWRGGVFYLVGGPVNDSDLLEYIALTGEHGEWSLYRKGWDKHQKADTKAKSAKSTALWRAREAEEESLSLLQSHISPSARLNFNPLFGTGGNAGKRDFASGWAKASAAIQNPPRSWNREKLNADLAAFLRGDPCTCLADYNAGCWFGAANKAYNSGTAKAFRDGQISPWAMAIACEAFGLFQGSASRRLGSARKAAGAFPFVTSGSSPTSAGEAGKNLGELWFPVWEQPMSLPEVAGLYQRGRAEVNGRGAISSPAFAAAILQRGVDLGIREFRRFLLLRTTSENTFESRLAAIVPVADTNESSTAAALTRMLSCRDSLPLDKKKGKRWIYVGLRGPLDQALVALAENPRPESARAAVDAMMEVLCKADRNRRHRAQKPSIQFQLLPGAWAAYLLGANGTDAHPEVRLGLALATIVTRYIPGKVNKTIAETFLPYWLGVKLRGQYCSMLEAVPFRRVWGGGALATNLCAVLQRRLMEVGPSDEPPFDAWYSVALGDIEAWLDKTVDDAEVERWAMRFSLFEWNKESVAMVGQRLGHADAIGATSADLSLFALFKPLFQTRLRDALISVDSVRKAAKAGPLPTITAQLARGDVSTAVRLARNAYRAAAIEPARLPSKEFACGDWQRLLAVLLISTREGADFANLSQRWLSPRKENNNL